MTLFSSASTNVARSSKLDKNILFCCSYEYLTHFTCSVVRELVSRLITCCSGKLLTTDRLVNTRATVTRQTVDTRPGTVLVIIHSYLSSEPSSPLASYNCLLSSFTDFFRHHNDENFPMIFSVSRYINGDVCIFVALIPTPVNNNNVDICLRWTRQDDNLISRGIHHVSHWALHWPLLWTWAPGHHQCQHAACV